MITLRQLKEILVEQKILFTYSYSWLSSIPIGFVFADTVHEYWFFVNFPTWVIFVGCFVSMWLFGLIMFKLGLFSFELGFATKHNPVLNDLINDSKVKKRAKKKAKK